MKLTNRPKQIEGASGSHKLVSFEAVTEDSSPVPDPLGYETFAAGLSPPETSTDAAPAGILHSASFNTVHLLPGINDTWRQDK